MAAGAVDEDEHYPQCYEVQGDSIGPGNLQEKPLDYQILWSVPVCGRDQAKHWHDIQHFREGSVRQALVFDYDIARPQGSQQTSDEHRLTRLVRDDRKDAALQDFCQR